MINFRAPGSDKWYAPERDVVNLFPQLARTAFDQLAETDWKPWFADYFRYAGLTEEELGKAAVALARFFKEAVDPDVADPRTALERAGWFELNPAAHVAVFMKLGQALTMAFWTGVRDVTTDAPPTSLDSLQRAAAAAASALLPHARIEEPV